MALNRRSIPAAERRPERSAGAPAGTSTLRALRDFARAGQRHRYGTRGSQTAELRLPSHLNGPLPVAVTLHGGYWQARHSRRMSRPVAADLARRGWATWNLEYRRIGRRQGGGWPTTFEDVAAGIDRLADLGDERLDLDRVVAIGHSAGGLLALWAAARPGLPSGAPGAQPRVRMGAAAALGAVTDLEASTQLTRPGQPVHALMGGSPDQVPERYEVANPRRRLPLEVPLLLVHGDADEVVPITRTREFAATAREAGDQVDVVEFPGGSHMAVADTRTAGWEATVSWLGELGWLSGD